MWPEVEQAKSENRRELKLSGSDISQKIEADGLDKDIFTLTSINLLNVNATSLSKIPSEIALLDNLQTLLLFNNKLEGIDVAVFNLEKLKMLDLSNNAITVVPEEINKLHNLFMLNLSGNLIEQFPDLIETKKLNTLDVSNNKLVAFPNVFVDPLTTLIEIKLKGNEIVSIPDEIDALNNLKLLDLSNNKITQIPKSVAGAAKLKDLELKGNPVADKRLLKLIDQCKTKQIVDYVKQHGSAVKSKSSVEKGGKQKSGKKSKTLSENSEENDGAVNKHRIIVEKVNDDTTLKVLYTEDVGIVRPYILCCLVKGVRFDEVKLKQFLQIQTKLHDTVCEKREASTIATHDLNKIKGPVKYTAKLAEFMEIQPLGSAVKTTGQILFDSLKEKAEMLRKEKKRNTYSGIHKFLYLLENKDVYPCLADVNESIISLPPLTNSEITKITLETRDIFVEVTSSKNAIACKKTMEALLVEMLKMGISEQTASGEEFKQITVQQIKIYTATDNTMKTLYPSKVDLNFAANDNIIVERI